MLSIFGAGDIRCGFVAQVESGPFWRGSGVVEHGGLTDDGDGAHQADHYIEQQEDPVHHQRHVLPIFLSLKITEQYSKAMSISPTQPCVVHFINIHWILYTAENTIYGTYSEGDDKLNIERIS